MIILTDGKTSAKITMCVWNGTNFSPCWAHDFFNVGTLQCTDEGAFIVPDYEYCEDMALEWERENENNTVWIEPM